MPSAGFPAAAGRPAPHANPHLGYSVAAVEAAEHPHFSGLQLHGDGAHGNWGPSKAHMDGSGAITPAAAAAARFVIAPPPPNPLLGSPAAAYERVAEYAAARAKFDSLHAAGMGHADAMRALKPQERAALTLPTAAAASGGWAPAPAHAHAARSETARGGVPRAQPPQSDLSLVQELEALILMNGRVLAAAESSAR